MTSDFGANFESRLGPARSRRIIDSFGTQPVVLVCGASGTGKSTLTRALCEERGGASISTGAVVRANAAERGWSMARYGAWLAENIDAEVDLDAAIALAIARGGVCCAEGRLVAHLGAWLRSRGRRGLWIVRLVCSVRERARRLIARELPGCAVTEVHQVLEKHDCSTLEEWALVLRSSRSPECFAAAAVLEREATREQDGWKRLGVLYGAVDGIDVDDTIDGSTEAAVGAIMKRTQASVEDTDPAGSATHATLHRPMDHEPRRHTA